MIEWEQEGVDASTSRKNHGQTNMLTWFPGYSTRLSMYGRSRDAAYWRHRIERDHPEIAARLDSGEISSVRAAAVAAGLIREPTGLMQLRRAWRRAGAEERAAFMAEVGVAELVPQARRAKRKRAVADDGSDLVDLFSLPLPLPQEPIRARRELTPSRASTALNLETSSAPLRVTPLRPMSELPRHSSEPEPAPLTDIAHEAPVETLPQRLVAAPAAHDPEAGEEAEGLDSESEEAPETTHEPQEEGHKARFGVRRFFGLAAAKGGEDEHETSRSEAMESPDGRVKVGQRYVKVDAGGAAWEVVGIFAGPLGVPHVRIANLQEPDTLRAVSVSALVDRNRYQLVR
ncbi:MAG: hypothetical protein ACHQRJ_00520 [Alphaproteobacteria bacterium]